VQRYVEMKVLEDSKWNIRCPGEGCRYHLIDDDINQALKDSVQQHEVLDKRARLRNENFAPRLEELLAARKAASTDCSEALLLAECQVCPSCSVLVRREGGCTHIACRCGQDFCFGCGAPFPEEDEDEDDPCICREREDEGVHVTEDDLQGEGRPLLGFWRQRKQDHSIGGEVLLVQNVTIESPSLHQVNVSDRWMQICLNRKDEEGEEKTLALGPVVGEPPKLRRANSLPASSTSLQ
jgi:hypothetical protein